MINQVLFTSCIFIFTEESYLHQICQTPKIMSFIHCGGKPSKINFNCIEGIMQMLSLEQEISVEPNFTEGEEVRIIYGPLAGYEGVLVIQKSKNRLGIHLKEINQTVFINICTSVVGN
jgi:transcription antitermination factor NusG